MPILKNPTAIANAANETRTRLASLGTIFAWFSARGHSPEAVAGMVEHMDKANDAELADICGGCEAELDELYQAAADASEEEDPDAGPEANPFEERDKAIAADTEAAASEFSADMAGPDNDT